MRILYKVVVKLISHILIDRSLSHVRHICLTHIRLLLPSSNNLSLLTKSMLEGENSLRNYRLWLFSIKHFEDRIQRYCLI